MPQQRGLIDPKLYTNYLRRRNVTGVILDPKGGDAGSVSPGVGKSLRTVQRERDDLTTARKIRKRLGKK